MKDIAESTELMAMASYSSKKKRIETLYAKIKQYMLINLRSSTVGRYLFIKGKLKPKGRADWDGFVDLKRERFNTEHLDLQETSPPNGDLADNRKNTAHQEIENTNSWSWLSTGYSSGI